MRLMFFYQTNTSISPEVALLDRLWCCNKPCQNNHGWAPFKLKLLSLLPVPSTCTGIQPPDSWRRWGYSCNQPVQLCCQVDSCCSQSTHLLIGWRDPRSSICLCPHPLGTPWHRWWSQQLAQAHPSDWETSWRSGAHRCTAWLQGCRRPWCTVIQGRTSY